MLILFLLVNDLNLIILLPRLGETLLNIIKEYSNKIINKLFYDCS